VLSTTSRWFTIYIFYLKAKGPKGHLHCSEVLPSCCIDGLHKTSVVAPAYRTALQFSRAEWSNEYPSLLVQVARRVSCISAGYAQCLSATLPLQATWLLMLVQDCLLKLSSVLPLLRWGMARRFSVVCLWSNGGDSIDCTM